MVAASEQPLELSGDPVSVAVRVPAQTSRLLEDAVEDAETRRIYVNVEDIQAAANPGVVYGVYLDLPDDVVGDADDRYYIGTVSLFGIERMNDPDDPHPGIPGFRHTFDATRRVAELRDRGEWDTQQLRVTFELLVPQPPPDLAESEGAAASDIVAEVVAEHRRWAAQTPVVIGRVSVFVE